MATSDFDDRPRVKKFRLELIKLIPRVPNNRASLQQMMTRSLRGVVLDYLNWASRYVTPRPRTVMVTPQVQSDPRWATMQPAITALLDKVARGDDLTAHLSLEPHTKGVAPVAQAAGASAEQKWSDKDQVLNIMGFHHFHLGTTAEPAGHMIRTNELFFAQVARDRFTVIALFDHDVFEAGTSERQRLHSVPEQVMFAGVAPGSAVIMSQVALSVHSMPVVLYTSRCIRVIKEIDPKLDDRSFVAQLYQDGERTPPKNPKLTWRFRGFDLGLGDTKEAIFFILQMGWS
jgi:hypothetical protein